MQKIGRASYKVIVYTFLYNYNIDILKWHRTEANTGKTNWEKFPDNALKNNLNENDFYLFIKEYIKNIKN